MAIRNLLSEYRRTAAAQQGQQQDEFLRQLGFMATYQRQPYAQDPQSFEFPRARRSEEGPSDAEIRARQKEANDAAAESVEAQLLQAKLGHQPKGRTGTFLDRWIAAGLEKIREGNADAADDPSMLAKYEALERGIADYETPQVAMSPEIAAAAAYSDDVKGLVSEMAGSGREAAISKKVAERSKLFQERSKQLSALLDPTSSPTAAKMALKNGTFGGLGIAVGRAYETGDKDAKMLMQEQSTRAATQEFLSLVQQHGIENARAILRGREVPVVAWKNPQADAAEMERGLMEFGKKFKLGDDTWSFGVQGENPADLEALRNGLRALQSGDIGDATLGDTQLSASIPENVRWLVRQYKDDKAQLKQIGQALVAEISGIPGENVNGVARTIAQEWVREMSKGEKQVFLVRHGDRDEDRRPILLGNDAWKKLAFSQDIKSDGHFQGQPSVASRHKLGEAQIAAAERLAKREWNRSIGTLGKKVEPEIRFTLRSMNLPEAEIDGIMQEGMPAFWQSWVRGGYGQLPESSWKQVREQAIMGAVNGFLASRGIAQRPGSEASGPAKTQQVIEEHEALKTAFGSQIPGTSPMYQPGTQEATNPMAEQSP